jgi:hypothetical protein
LDFFTAALLFADRSSDDKFASLKALAVTTAMCEHGRSQISKTAMTGDSLADLGIESPRLSLLFVIKSRHGSEGDCEPQTIMSNSDRQ